MKKTRNLSAMYIKTVIASILVAFTIAGCFSPDTTDTTGSSTKDTGMTTITTVSTQTPTTDAAEYTQAPTDEITAPTQDMPTETTEPIEEWKTGYVATSNLNAVLCDGEGRPLVRLLRGKQVEYRALSDGKTEILVNGISGYLPKEAYIVASATEVIPAHTLYVRTAVNLRNADGKLLEALANKGQAVQVTGFDYLYADGKAHMYRVNFDGQDGYMMPWYLVDNEADALANYDAGIYAVHAERGSLTGGGNAAELDYYPREKGPIEGNKMPEECRSIYLGSWLLQDVDAYIEMAKNSGINAFVVDIADNSVVGYASDVMKQWCPTGAAAANNSVEGYKAAIQRLKDAGFYVIGRITTFKDVHFVWDNPELAITHKNGIPFAFSGQSWTSPFNREVWQYKVDLAVEAVELMGFHEIQFDYVRFPDTVRKYETEGKINLHNTYGETKTQAIQRFLMYAADILREHGAYVSADVFGECAYAYVTSYGQYWAAISNVVDAISGMPYPDLFGLLDGWLPWEHPYETLYEWGKKAISCQSETPTPAAVRTWIQAFDSSCAPYNTYGPDEVFAQIKGLRDSGCTGGYMTWNADASVEEYTNLLPAFTPPEKQQPQPNK